MKNEELRIKKDILERTVNYSMRIVKLHRELEKDNCCVQVPQLERVPMKHRVAEQGRLYRQDANRLQRGP
jgi:hypothetical protein